MARQVRLMIHGFWADIISECDVFILAKDLDGVMVYVVKDGTERVRNGSSDGKN